MVTTHFELTNIPKLKDLLHTYLLCTIREIMLMNEDKIKLVVPKDSPYLPIELFYPLRHAIFEEIKNGTIISPSLYLRRTGDSLFLIKVR